MLASAPRMRPAGKYRNCFRQRAARFGILSTVFSNGTVAIGELELELTGWAFAVTMLSPIPLSRLILVRGLKCWSVRT